MSQIEEYVISLGTKKLTHDGIIAINVDTIVLDLRDDYPYLEAYKYMINVRGYGGNYSAPIVIWLKRCNNIHKFATFLSENLYDFDSVGIEPPVTQH